MIGIAARILIGLIIGAAVCVALTVALCVDLFASETRRTRRIVAAAKATSERPRESAWSAKQRVRGPFSEAHI